jgi:hypothetical protein
MAGLRVIEAEMFVQNMRTRMPFRYGIATLTALPHLILRVTVLIDGKRHHGWAADHLPPKWFTKDPSTSPRQEIEDMIAVIRGACAHAIEVGECATVEDLSQGVAKAQATCPPRPGMPPLLLNFGVSLVERAAIDAFCRARGATFADALRSGALGMDGGDAIPPAPLRSIIVRHTVGLSDPLSDGDLDDGLPQSLEDCVRQYGLTRFKIKLSGDADQDASRLRDIARVLAPMEYAFTLDGNENYKSMEAFEAFWDRVRGEEMMRRLLFIEQPLHRDIALSVKVSEKLPPMIIDESDATPDALPRALECGYAGTSHKNCKGVLKSIAAAKLIARRRREQPDRTFILSAEDLSNVGPIALLQDLAVVASLGIEHAERNGHHYFRGLSAFDPRIQDRVSESHGDLYMKHERGFATPIIRDGRMSTASVVDAPFGYSFDFASEGLTPLDQWDFDSFSRSVMS